MERTKVNELKEKIGQKVTIAGFIHAIRDQGGIIFLFVRDLTGIIQVVVLRADKEPFELAKSLTHESVVKIEGSVKEEKQAPEGFELKADKIELLSKADPELPIPVVVEKGGEEPDVSLRFDWRWLDLRRPEKQMIFKVWTQLEKSFREYFDQNGFTQLYTPSFMVSPSESGADVFEVKYFDKKAYLAQSPQFYKQMAMASGLEKVFTFGPVFRAELSFTTRHMTEFTGWDAEISYIESHLDIMKMEEEILVKCFTDLNNKLGLNLEIPKAPFPKITVAEAKEELKKEGIKNEKDYDINDEEERKLAEVVKKKTGSDFVFITDYPQKGRAFYHMRYDDNKEITKGFDLIYKGIEITTGAQREHRYEILKKQAEERGMDLKPLEDYLNFFKYGCPPHGGVGIGPGRIVMKILDLPSVKEATYLPRDVKRLRP